MEQTFDRSNDELQWGDRIPFDDGPSPSAAPVAYRWLLESGVPAAEARFRVYGWPRTRCTRPLVAANAWRQFSNTYDADDGYNPATVADEWQPSALAVRVTAEIMKR